MKGFRGRGQAIFKEKMFFLANGVGKIEYSHVKNKVGFLSFTVCENESNSKWVKNLK